MFWPGTIATRGLSQYSTLELLHQAFLQLAQANYQSQWQPPFASTPVTCPAKLKPQQKLNAAPQVKLSVNYPSKLVNQTLAPEYEALGKAMIHGPPSRIVNAIFKCPPLSNLVIEKVLRLFKTEVGDLCSTKVPWLLRKSSKEDLVTIDLEKLCSEWKERAPLFYAFLLTACTTGKRQETVTWLPSMAIPGSILLKQRDTRMNATASILSVLLKTRSVEV